MDEKNISDSYYYEKLYQSRATTKLSRVVDNIGSVNATFMTMIGKITGEIEKQKHLIIKAKGVCEDTKPYFAEVVNKTKDIAKVSKEALIISQEGKSEIESAISSINKIRETVEDISKVIYELKKQSEEIEKLALTITDIADSTKIIAFNSSIAAYKAGSFGASFSVVANEIKVLSHKTTEQVGEINEYIHYIRSNTGKMSEKMEDSLSKVETLREVVINSQRKLNQIVSSIEKTNAVSLSIKSMTNNLVVNNEDIIKKIDVINDFVGNILNLSECSLSNTKQQIDSVKLLRNTSELIYEITNLTKIESINNNNKNQNSLNTAIPKPNTFDPALCIYSNDQQFGNYFTIRLTKYSKDKTIIPFLAEKWVLSSDKKTWIFTLKKDVKFHNGNTVRARDVKFSFERLLNPKLNSPHLSMFKIIEGSDEYIKGEAKEVSGIVIEDDYNISFRLKQVCNYFLSLLTQIYTSILEKNDQYLTKPFEQPVSAGAFIVTGLNEEEEYFILKANKDFVMGTPYIDQINVYFGRGGIKEKFILSEDLDFVNTGAFGNLSKLLREKEGSEYLIKTVDSRTMNGININFLKDNFITRNKEIRQALSYAVNKDKIINEVYNNNATKADFMFHSSIIKPGNAKRFDYNPQKARQILDSYKSKENLKEEITLLKLKQRTGETANTRAIDEIYRQLKEIGLNIKLVEIPVENFKDNMFRDYDLCFMGWIPDLDPYLALEPFINPNGADNFFGYENPELYNKLSESLNIKDASERMKYLSNILDIFNDDVFMIPLIFQHNYYIYKSYIKNIKIDIVTQDVVIEDLIIDISEKTKQTEKDILNKNEFYHITNNYNKAVDKTNYSIDCVTNISTNLLDNTGKIIDQIEKQTATIEDTYKIIEGFIQSSDFVEEQTKSTLSTVKSAILESQQGKIISNTIIKSLDLLKLSINSVTSVVDRMKSNINSILSITKKIDETTENINSIAINAAIIAAKSGVWSEDFKTVSYEVRKLSTGTKKEIEKIVHLIEGMNSTIERVFVEINKSINQVENSKINIRKSDEVLINISNEISKTENISLVISDKIENLAEVIYQILNAMTSVKKSSYNTYNVAESVSFSSDLQSAIIEVLKGNSFDLSFVYRMLEKEISKQKEHNIAYDGENSLAIYLKPYTLNFDESFDVDSDAVISLFSSGMIKQENLNNLVPAIAESWVLEEDNLTWTFHIRKGLKFHNGQELNCEDIKYSLEKILKIAGEDISVGMSKIKGIDEFIKGKVDNVEGIKINNENNTVIIRLTEPHSIFDNEIAFNFLIYPKNLIDTPEGKLISCGPYKFIEHNEQSKYYQFKSNKDYYEGEPFINSVRVYYEIEDALTSFLNKELDFIPLEKKEHIDKIMNMPEYRNSIIEYSAFISCLVPVFDYDNIFSKHKEIRRAILYSINREKIVSEIYRNRARVQHSYLPVDMFLKSKNLKHYNYNKHKAKDLINSVKSKTGNELDRAFKLAYHNTYNDESLNELVKYVVDDLNEVGLNFEPHLVPREEIINYDQNKHKWDLFFVTYTPIEDSIYSSFATLIKNGFNGYNNIELSKKLDSILLVRDPKIREKVMFEISDEISEILPVIPLINTIDYYVYQPYLMNVNSNDTKVGFINFKDIVINKYKK